MIRRLALLLVLVQTANADFSQLPERMSFRDDVVGLGALLGRVGDTDDRAAVLEGNHHFSQRRAHFNMRQYGLTESRLEASTAGLGIFMSATAGVGWVGLEDGQSGFSLLVGSELFNGRLSFHTQDQRDGFYEWLPGAGVGFQMGSGTCRLLSLARGGASIGNRAKEGLLPAFRYAYGSGAYFNCAQWDLAVEWLKTLRVQDDSQSAVFDLSFRIGEPRNLLRLGVRGERLQYSRAEVPEALDEKRIMAVMRFGFE